MMIPHQFISSAAARAVIALALGTVGALTLTTAAAAPASRTATLATVPHQAVVVAAAPGPANCPVPFKQVLRTAPGSVRTVALTLDDGPSPSTPKILDILKKHRVHATFFVNGWTITRSATMRSHVQRAIREGHLVGTHTFDHPKLTQLSAAGQSRQIVSTAQLVAGISGTWPCWFRPPYGAYNATTRTILNQQRMNLMLWNVDTQDYTAGSSYRGPIHQKIMRIVATKGATKHPAILMHDGPTVRRTTEVATETIIQWYKKRGYKFVRVDNRI